ncbi:hypothetical protein niasHS_015424 [Heterodera schachtii]|uniref:Uncharacterized protein n=1 Tax=Heterodera schachtii TaxID=97005 RepID=A0ABD2HWF8_HETSC
MIRRIFNLGFAQTYFGENKKKEGNCDGEELSWRREEQQIPADIQQEEPFQPAPQPSIPIHPQLSRKRKAQHALNDVRESKKSLIGLEELRPPSLQQEASLRFKQKRTNKSRVTLPQHSNSLAVAKLRNPPRDLLAEAASAPLPDDDADDFGLLQSPGIAAKVQPLPPGPPLPSKAKKRKSNKVDEDTERKSIRIDSRKRDLLAEAASAPLPDDFELSQQQPGTSAQVEPLPPGPPLPSRTKKRKTNKAEEDIPKEKEAELVLERDYLPQVLPKICQKDKRTRVVMHSPKSSVVSLQRINIFSPFQIRNLLMNKREDASRNEAGESQGARRIDASVSNEGSQAEVDGPANNRNGNPNQKPASQATKMEKAIENVLERLYNDPKSPAAFAGVDRLWLEAKKELGNKIRKK